MNGGIVYIMKRERNYAIDIIKTIAIVGVITIHSCYEGYGYPIGSFNWLSTLFFGSLTRASVPLFLMCSGVLLLDTEKDITIRKIYSKNMLRIVAALFFWAIAYKIFILAVFQGYSINALPQILKEVLVFKHESHLYYLHIMIIVYAFVPITRIIIRNANQRELQYILGVWFVLGIVYPLAKRFWPFTLLTGIPTQWLINMTYSSIGYGVLGYYLHKYAKSSKLIYAVFSCVGFLGVFIGTWIGSVNNATLYQVFFEGMSPFVAFMAIGIFGLVRCIKTFNTSSISNMPEASLEIKNTLLEANISETSATKDERNNKKSMGTIFKRIFTSISKASFCIYLVHKFFIYIFDLNGLKVSILPAFLSIPLLVSANLICSVIVYFVLSRIPVVNKYLI